MEAITHIAVDLLWDLRAKESIGTLVFKCSFKYLSENISTLTGKSKSKGGGENNTYILGIATVQVPKCI